MKPQAQGEIPLLLFTTLMPTSVGISLAGLFFESSFYLSLGALIVAAVGVFASIAHLAKPLRAPFSIKHFESSWLSREIIVAGAYSGLTLIWFVCNLFELNNVLIFAVNVLTVFVGLLLLVAITLAYKLNSIPAWNGWEGLLEVSAIMFGSGLPLGLSIGLVHTEIYTLPLAICLIAFAIPLALGGAVMRKNRLEKSDKTRRVQGSLKRYILLKPLVKTKIALYCFAFVLAVSVFLLPTNYMWSSLLASGILGLGAALISRWVFYDVPKFTRFVPKFR